MTSVTPHQSRLLERTVTANLITQEESMQEARKYPTKEEIAADVERETAAINIAVTAMHEALADCPLPNHVRIYAVCELLFKLGDAEIKGTDYLEEVFNEIRAVRSMGITPQ